MGVGDGLNQDDSDEEGERWLDSRYVVKVEQPGFIDRLNVRYYGLNHVPQYHMLKS